MNKRSLVAGLSLLLSFPLPAAAQMRAQAGAAAGSAVPVVPAIEGGVLPSAGTLSASFTPLGLGASLAAPSAPAPLLTEIPTAPQPAPQALAVATQRAAAASGTAIRPAAPESGNVPAPASSFIPAAAPVRGAAGRVLDVLAVRPAASVSFDGERERTKLVDAAAAAADERAPLAKALASAPSRPDRTPAPPSAPEAPRETGFGGGRILGALLIGLSFIPVISGLMGLAGAPVGTLPLIVGASLLLPGLFLGFRTAPVKDPFYVFLAMAGGFFGGGSLTGALVNGNPGNAWILTAIYGITAAGMMGVDAMKGRAGGSSAARQASSWIAFGGYIAGMIMMIALKDWHGGVGVLLGLGVAAGVGFVSLALPPLLDKLKALLSRGGTQAAKGPDARWNFLARDPRAAVWGGGILGALLSGAVLLFGLTAVSALFSIAFAAPVLGVGAGYWLHRYAKRKSGL